MGKTNPRETTRAYRKRRIRRRVFGQTERPRLTVFRSNKHIYAQIIDDTRGMTLASASDMSPALREELQGLKKRERAQKVGLYLAGLCEEAGIVQVVFDRNGYMYHGRVMALADGAREGGLNF